MGEKFIVGTNRKKERGIRKQEKGKRNEEIGINVV